MAKALVATGFAPGFFVSDYICDKYFHRSGVDVAFESSGSAAAFSMLFEAACRESTIVASVTPAAPSNWIPT